MYSGTLIFAQRYFYLTCNRDQNLVRSDEEVRYRGAHKAYDGCYKIACEFLTCWNTDIWMKITTNQREIWISKVAMHGVDRTIARLDESRVPFWQNAVR